MYVCGYLTVLAKKHRPQTFFCDNPQKNIEDLHLFTEKPGICIFRTI